MPGHNYYVCTRFKTDMYVRNKGQHKKLLDNATNNHEIQVPSYFIKDGYDSHLYASLDIILLSITLCHILYTEKNWSGKTW